MCSSSHGTVAAVGLSVVLLESSKKAQIYQCELQIYLQSPWKISYPIV